MGIGVGMCFVGMLLLMIVCKICWMVCFFRIVMVGFSVRLSWMGYGSEIWRRR